MSAVNPLLLIKANEQSPLAAEDIFAAWRHYWPNLNYSTRKGHLIAGFGSEVLVDLCPYESENPKKRWVWLGHDKKWYCVWETYTAVKLLGWAVASAMTQLEAAAPVPETQPVADPEPDLNWW